MLIHSKKQLFIFVASVAIVIPALFITYLTYVLTNTKTTQATDDSVSFYALGDTGTGTLKQNFVATMLNVSCKNSGHTDAVIMLGDNIYPDGVASVQDELWNDRFENVYDGECLSALPFYAMPGNHDYYGNIDAQVDYSNKNMGTGRWKMPATHYIKNFKNSHGTTLVRLVVLDTERDVSQQLPILETAFKDLDTNIWRIVAGHVPIRSFSKKYGDNKNLVNVLLPELQKFHVHAYLSGHAHNLQILKRENEPLYVVSGGGGKAPRALTKNAANEPSLLYGKRTLGFTRIIASKDKLKLDVISLFDGSIVQFELFKELYTQNQNLIATNLIKH